MKLNWAERWVVNSPPRVMEQKVEIMLFSAMRPLAPGARVLEIGCGRGAGAALIYKKFRPSLLLAQDLDIRMIRLAQRHLWGGTANISLSVADACRIPFQNEAFDAVFGFGFLHHVPDWQQALREVVRVLKTGGAYYLEELYPGLYQNVVTRRILLHPQKNRFKSRDLRTELKKIDLPIRQALEVGRLGVLGVAVKR